MRDKICFSSVDVEREGIEETSQILDTFKKYGVSATLFVTGNILGKYTNLIKEWARDYEIACHSFTHRFWNTLNTEQRKTEIDKFTELYQSVFQRTPKGFRAPSHLIDKEGIRLLEEKDFLYDSSIVPHYVPFKKYRGYRGRAPLMPYQPEGRRMLEIPVRGQIFGIPLAGAWIRRLPPWFYVILFSVYTPEFITLSMHSWDILDPRFLQKLDKIIKILKKKNYLFLNGEQILKNRG